MSKLKSQSIASSRNISRLKCPKSNEAVWRWTTVSRPTYPSNLTMARTRAITHLKQWDCSLHVRSQSSTTLLVLPSTRPAVHTSWHMEMSRPSPLSLRKSLPILILLISHRRSSMWMLRKLICISLRMRWVLQGVLTSTWESAWMKSIRSFQKTVFKICDSPIINRYQAGWCQQSQIFLT